MNYMLLIYQDEDSSNQPKDAQGEPTKTCGGLVERLEASGQYRASGILQPTTSATSVRLRHGNRPLTDGPFAETREQLAGYLLIDAADLDAAIAVAMQHPVVKTGTVEIRPVKEIPVPAPSASAATA